MTKRKHWLSRPQTIRRLWIVFIGILTLTVAADFLVDVHGHFGIDATLAFNAWYGFVTCVAMIVFAKTLGIFLKRKDTYYDG